MSTVDFAIVGAGIAGASLGWELAAHGSVLLLERESLPGYHTTGRSAALFLETYGTPAIRAMTRASRPFLQSPPPGFCDSAILSPRGVVYIAGPDQLDLLDATEAELRPHAPQLERLSADALAARHPCLRREALGGGLQEGGAADIDVHSLHQGYLRGLRQRGGALRTDAEVVAAKHHDGLWNLTLADGSHVRARTLVNAAGAWADVLGEMAGAAPIGLTPCRRTAFTFPAPEGMDLARMPAIIAVDESFYIKPDARQLLGSPANADPTTPHDVMPEEIDVATGIFHIEEMTHFTIRRPTHTWAGLRSFVPDGEMVIGWDGGVGGLFWLAAQGGYGIQSAPAYALLARNLVLGETLDESLQAQGVDPAAMSPARLR
ncbi:NAD(P)/FAD-dependent oxidoreductase [Simplicispira hankyongi]|uniref:FAD-binding oxidoreductase n=1 Tax=Simplicispira hankyongi TaxID=2315688 RepID=A0A398C8M3_9BURK|nr:FAD-binding oxidoreductase [Simplicispira hankyongi]RID97921.1 FAD-binding oxidoreductase [Simplicispira hankyongi]